MRGHRAWEIVYRRGHYNGSTVEATPFAALSAGATTYASYVVLCTDTITPPLPPAKPLSPPPLAPSSKPPTNLVVPRVGAGSVFIAIHTHTVIYAPTSVFVVILHNADFSRLNTSSCSAFDHLDLVVLKCLIYLFYLPTFCFYIAICSVFDKVYFCSSITEILKIF